MPANQFLPYATGTGANVDTQSAFVGRGLALGQQPSTVAPSSYANKLWRQSSFVIAGVTTFMMNVLSTNVNDDGNLANFVTNLTAAIAGAAPVQSFNGRTGAITLTQSDVDTALTYVPANKAGDTFSGAVNFSNGIDVTSGGATITGGLTVSTGTLTAGAAQFSGAIGAAAGMHVTAGLVTLDAGLHVTAGAVTLPAGSIANAALALQADGTVLANFSGSSASPTPNGIAALLTKMGLIGDGASYLEIPFWNGSALKVYVVQFASAGSVAAGSVTPVTFPIAMTTGLFLFPSADSSGGSTQNAGAQLVDGTLTGTGASIKLQVMSGSGGPSQVVNYLVIGIK